MHYISFVFFVLFSFIAFIVEGSASDVDNHGKKDAEALSKEKTKHEFDELVSLVKKITSDNEKLQDDLFPFTNKLTSRDRDYLNKLLSGMSQLVTVFEHRVKNCDESDRELKVIKGVSDDIQLVFRKIQDFHQKFVKKPSKS